jgi:hypothetical protein
MGLAPWNAGPALIDGSLVSHNPKLIENLRQNIELEEHYFKRHSVVEP